MIRAISTLRWPCWRKLQNPGRTSTRPCSPPGADHWKWNVTGFVPRKPNSLAHLALDPRRVEARRRLIDLDALQGRSADIAAQVRELGKAGLLDFPYLYAWTLGLRAGSRPGRARLASGACRPG